MARDGLYPVFAGAKKQGWLELQIRKSTFTSIKWTEWWKKK